MISMRHSSNSIGATGEGNKMFKLQKHKKQHPTPTPPAAAATKSGERFDFNFSDFQALLVPKGWDKLYVSIISVETGKTIAKSGKAPVRNGTCQWAETLSESLWIPHNDSSKELVEYLFKLVISMGSARSGILGESIVDMSRYKSLRASGPVSLPLKKCNYGTILQVKIHCLTTRTKLRDEESKYSNSRDEVREEDHHNNGRKSNGTDESLAVSLRSQSSQDLGSTSHPENLGSTETSYPASDSNHSFVSEEGTVTRESLSPPKGINGDRYSAGGRQDAVRSGNNSADSIHPADDPFISNHSSFNSKITHSGDDFQNYEEEYGQCSSPHIATSSLTFGSSKNLLEAAEDTIEELRDEAKMWERNSRKLMLDLDILREKFSSQSKKQTNVEMELSAAHAERDGMKKEVEQLNFLLEESVVKRTSTKDSTIQLEGVIHIRKELENEIKFQKEENVYLALQLEKSRESNIEFLSVLQELEETIEKQKVEIEDLSELHVRYNDLEGSIQGKLEENRILLLQLNELQESEQTLLVKVQVLEQTLEAKNTEVENERGSYQQSLLDVEREYKCKLSVTEEEIVNLNAKLVESLTGRQRKMGFTNGSSVDLLTEIKGLEEKMQELERDCSELTDENLELLCKLQELEKVVEKDRLANSETSDLYTELLKQLEMAFHHIKRPWYNIPFEVNGECDSHYHSLVSMKNTNTIASKAWAEPVLNYFMDLNKLLEARITNCEEVIKIGEFEINKRDRTIAEAKSQMEYLNLKVQELECSNMELEANLANLRKDMAEKKSEVEMFEADLQSKEEQLNLFRRCQMELKAQPSEIEKERDQLQENMEIALRESNITSKCLDDLRNDIMVLSSSVDCKVSANKILQKKTSELETEKRKLELHLFEVEEENVQLSERVSGLEAQMRNVEEEKESNQLELENSKYVVMGLQDDIKRLTVEMETEKVVLQEKLQDLENQLSEAQEECEYLKIAYQKSQASGESLTENCNTLQKLNAELRKQKLELHENFKSDAMGLQDEIRRLTVEMETEKVFFQEKLQETENRLSEVQEECEYQKIANQKSQVSADKLTENCNTLQKMNGKLRNQNLELHGHCIHLETKLRESQQSLSDSCKRIKYLEENLSSVLEEFASKEKSLTSELDVLLQENREQKEKLIQEESLLNQMYLEKTAEVENLQREVEHLINQISAINDERDRIASEAVNELSILRSDREKLECAFQEISSRVILTEDELDRVQTEYKSRIQGLIAELAASNQSHADHEKVLKSLASYRSSKEKLKTSVNDLELKLTVSEYERQQLIDETANLKAQLQKIARSQEDVLSLKSRFEESKLEKKKLEDLLHSISVANEELKAENSSFAEKVSSLQKAMSEFEDCKHKRVALEEKLLHMEHDLTAKEVSNAEDSELRLEEYKLEKKKLEALLHSISVDNEELKAENRSFAEKISSLQKAMSEFEDCKHKRVALEEKLLHMEHDLTAKEASNAEDGELRNELSQMKRANKQHKRKIQQFEGENDELLKRAQSLDEDLKLMEAKKHDQNKSGNEKGDNEYGSQVGSPHAVGVDYVEKVQVLENELAEALEANNRYKIQLQSHSAAPGKSVSGGEVVAKERYERTKSSLETELIDLRDRYFQMSLRYAEVEAQREDLVMKLKTSKNGKRWFL